MIFIKKFYFIVILSSLLVSCGLIGGNDKEDISENAVLSGPPLAIPPEFDIDSQNTNQQQSVPTFDMETLEEGNNIDNFEDGNENVFTDEAPAMTNIENTGEIQSFESFNPNNTVTINRKNNVKTSPRTQKVYKPTVPSDAYSFDRVISKKQNKYVQRKKDNFSSFGDNQFEQIDDRNPGALSKEEEFLLDDIINQEDNLESGYDTIPDFESRGDSD
tara:strand:+ start:243 stop:893 length:651 start_codon:yes stop_codon:yes gene_type:complete